MHVALAEPKAGGKSGDPSAIDDAVGNQAQRAAGDIGASVPLWRTGRGVGLAALASTKPSGLSRGGRSKEAHVDALGQSRGAAGPAVHAR
jgi:hypothetical protein